MVVIYCLHTAHDTGCEESELNLQSGNLIMIRPAGITGSFEFKPANSDFNPYHNSPPHEMLRSLGIVCVAVGGGGWWGIVETFNEQTTESINE